MIHKMLCPFIVKMSVLGILGVYLCIRLLTPTYLYLKLRKYNILLNLNLI